MGLEVVEGGAVAVGVDGEPVVLVLDVDALLADGAQLPRLGQEHDDESDGTQDEQAKTWKKEKVLFHFFILHVL